MVSKMCSHSSKCQIMSPLISWAGRLFKRHPRRRLANEQSIISICLWTNMQHYNFIIDSFHLQFLLSEPGSSEGKSAY